MSGGGRLVFRLLFEGSSHAQSGTWKIRALEWDVQRRPLVLMKALQLDIFAIDVEHHRLVRSTVCGDERAFVARRRRIEILLPFWDQLLLWLVILLNEEMAILHGYGHDDLG